MKKKKKIKIHYGNLFILVLVIGVLIFGGLYINKTFLNKGDEKIKSEVSSNENKKLKSLGYSSEEIKKIASNLTEEDINKIKEKYDNLDDFSNVKYFHIENLERYQNLKNNSSYSIEEVVMRVNTGIDRDFYTNIKTVEDPDDLFVLVNKYNALPLDYEPDDLIEVGNGQRMKSEAGEYLKKMLRDINNEGLYLQAQSGFRSISLQTRLYNNYVDRDGKEEADTYSARPGHSEHHTGLAIDVSHDGSLEESFENTEQFDWLSEHAHEYGFILRYPKDKVYMTGYIYEPWHYRYVGVEVATLIHNEKITFEEYLVKYKGLY